jgi:peptidyl-prolyl cis-trans isomerase D
MFELIRKNTKILAIPLFLLIILAFVISGNGTSGFGDNSGATVATVGKHSITQGEWDAAHKLEVDRLRSSAPDLDPKMLDSAEAKYMTLERLVKERVLAEAAQTMHLNISDARLASELQQNPTLAALRRPDGSLDTERYAQLVSSQGLTPAGFEARVRKDMALRQVELGVVGTAFAPNALSDAAFKAFFERREVQVAQFAASDFASKVIPSDADIEAFYQANTTLFQAPEEAKVEYVVLDLDAIQKGMLVNESELRAYYDQNVKDMAGSEERRASHILIKTADTMTAAEREQAKAKAQAVLDQVRKAPNSFADVARKNSQDEASAVNGGDLGFFKQKDMVKPFADAAFGLQKDMVSDLVQTQFGFHIIRLTDIKAPKLPSFEEVRPRLEAQYKAQQAKQKFVELAETFTNTVYEQSDGYRGLAERLKLEVKTADHVRRQAQPSASDVLSNPKLLAALFSADSIEKKRNTEAVELGGNQLVSARIVEYTPAHAMPLADVRMAVRARLIASRAAELAKKEGADRLAAWKNSPDTAKLGATMVVSRDSAQSIPVRVVDAALRADPTKLPAWVGVDLGAQGYAVVKVNRVLPGVDHADDVTRQVRTQYAQALAAAERDAYYAGLKTLFKVQIKVPRPVVAKELDKATE